MENFYDDAIFAIVLHQHGLILKSNVSCFFVSPGRVPYAIFVVVDEILELFIMKL